MLDAVIAQYETIPGRRRVARCEWPSSPSATGSSRCKAQAPCGWRLPVTPWAATVPGARAVRSRTHGGNDCAAREQSSTESMADDHDMAGSVCVALRTQKRSSSAPRVGTALRGGHLRAGMHAYLPRHRHPAAAIVVMGAAHTTDGRLRVAVPPRSRARALPPGSGAAGGHHRLKDRKRSFTGFAVTNHLRRSVSRKNIASSTQGQHVGRVVGGVVESIVARRANQRTGPGARTHVSDSYHSLRLEHTARRWGLNRWWRRPGRARVDAPAGARNGAYRSVGCSAIAGGPNSHPERCSLAGFASTIELARSTRFCTSCSRCAVGRRGRTPVSASCSWRGALHMIDDGTVGEAAVGVTRRRPRHRSPQRSSETANTAHSTTPAMWRVPSRPRPDTRSYLPTTITSLLRSSM